MILLITLSNHDNIIVIFCQYDALFLFIKPSHFVYVTLKKIPFDILHLIVKEKKISLFSNGMLYLLF
jgi:hypothetical protein